MDTFLAEPQPRPHLTKAVAVITGVIAFLVVCAWFVYEYSDVLWPDQAYKSAWYLGSDKVLYAFQDGTLTSIVGMPEGVTDAARTSTSHALIIEEATGAAVFHNGERVASGTYLRDVALSPDGTQVAFARSASGDAAPSAWEIVRIVDNEEHVVAQGFSPYFVDESHLVYFDEKGAWLFKDGEAVTQLSGVAFSDVQVARTAQSPDRTGLMFVSDTNNRPFVFSIPSVAPLEFTQVSLMQTVPIMPIASIALADAAGYTLHTGSPTKLWVHTAKHPEGRALESLQGVETVIDIIFAP